MKTNHFKIASIKTKHLLKINKYLICLPVCHVTINHQRTVNMQMCYFVQIINMVFISSSCDVEMLRKHFWTLMICVNPVVKCCLSFLCNYSQMTSDCSLCECLVNWKTFWMDLSRRLFYEGKCKRWKEELGRISKLWTTYCYCVNNM